MNKHGKNTDHEDTLKSDPVVSAVSNVAVQLRGLAKSITEIADRLDQAAGRITGITGSARLLALRDVCGLVRKAGDASHGASEAAHDMARSIENFLTGQ